MTLLHDAVAAKKFDIRLSQRNLDRGLLTQDEIKKSSDALEDDAANAEYISIESLAESDAE